MQHLELGRLVSLKALFLQGEFRYHDVSAVKPGHARSDGLTSGRKMERNHTRAQLAIYRS